MKNTLSAEKKVAETNKNRHFAPKTKTKTNLGRSLLSTTCFIFTGSIARSAKREYLSYSEADFEVFRPTGATRCTDGGEIWHGGGDALLHIKFHFY